MDNRTAAWLLFFCLGVTSFGQAPQEVRLNRAIELFEKGLPPLARISHTKSGKSCADRV